MAASLVIRLTGGIGNITPNVSLGGLMSDAALNTNITMYNLFRLITNAQRATGCTLYRAVDIYNLGPDTATAVSMWFSSNTQSTRTELRIGKEAVSNPHHVSDNLQTIADEFTPPSSPVITFSAAATASRLTMCNLAISHANRIWFRLVVNPAAYATSIDSVNISLACT